MKSRTLILALGLLAIPGVASADPKEVGSVAYQVSGSHWDKCLTEIDAALAAGDTLDTIANLFYSEIPGATAFTSSNGNHQWSAPLSAVRSYCSDKEAEWQATVVLSDIESTLASARDLYATYFAAGDEVPWDAVDTIDRVAAACPAQIDAAIASGVKASTKVSLHGGTAITLADARTKYCDPLVAAVAKMTAQKAAEEEALWGPYKKLLKGGKLDLVLARGTTGWYGKGCKQLATAKQLAKAKVWYEISVDTSGVEPRWTARAYKFKGNKLAGTKDKSGWGNDAPSSACR